MVALQRYELRPRHCHFKYEICTGSLVFQSTTDSAREAVLHVVPHAGQHEIVVVDHELTELHDGVDVGKLVCCSVTPGAGLIQRNCL